MKAGDITDQIILKIATIFEINLLIFDIRQSKKYVYWTHTKKYPYLNIFKSLFCIIKNGNHYEPITKIREFNDELKLYEKILIDIEEIEFYRYPMINVYTLLYMRKIYDRESQIHINIMPYIEKMDDYTDREQKLLLSRENDKKNSRRKKN